MKLSPPVEKAWRVRWSQSPAEPSCCVMAQRAEGVKFALQELIPVQWHYYWSLLKRDHISAVALGTKLPNTYIWGMQANQNVHYKISLKIWMSDGWVWNVTCLKTEGDFSMGFNIRIYLSPCSAPIFSRENRPGQQSHFALKTSLLG